MDSFKNINCTFIPILIFPRLLPSEHHWVTSHHWITPPVWPGRQSCGRYTECMPLALLRGGYQHLLPHLARSSWSTVTKLLHCCKERCFRNTYPTTRLHILYLEGLVYSNYCFLGFFPVFKAVLSAWVDDNCTAKLKCWYICSNKIYASLFLPNWTNFIFLVDPTILPAYENAYKLTMICSLCIYLVNSPLFLFFEGDTTVFF